MPQTTDQKISRHLNARSKFVRTLSSLPSHLPIQILILQIGDGEYLSIWLKSGSEFDLCFGIMEVCWSVCKFENTVLEVVVVVKRW